MCKSSGTSFVRTKQAKIVHDRRRVAKITELKAHAVVLGIQHLFRRQRRVGDINDKLDDRGNIRGGSSGASSTNVTEVQCQLCESTRRVLRAARAHSKLVGHDRKGCEACKMWSLVGARYTYLQRLSAANAAADVEAKITDSNGEVRLTDGDNGGDAGCTLSVDSSPVKTVRKQVRFAERTTIAEYQV